MHLFLSCVHVSEVDSIDTASISLAAVSAAAADDAEASTTVTTAAATDTETETGKLVDATESGVQKSVSLVVKEEESAAQEVVIQVNSSRSWLPVVAVAVVVVPTAAWLGIRAWSGRDIVKELRAHMQSKYK